MKYEFSCHTWGFNDLTLLEALGTIARMGFRYVDIGTGTHLNLSQLAQARERQQMTRELVENLTLFNLKVADLYLMLPRISVDDEKKRQTDIALFKALLPMAKVIQARGVTISSGLIHPPEDTDAQTRMIDALTEMQSYAESHEVPLSIEPHLDSMAQKPETALKLLEQVEGLELTVDWAHLVCQGIALDEIVSLLPHARHVQIRQAANGKLQTAFDDGEIDLDQVINALENANYEGVLSIEYMKTKSARHSMAEVDSVTESVKLRDALRDVRDMVD